MIVDLVIRAGVVGAVILASKNYGIWDSPEQTEELYNNSSEYIWPYAESARQRLGLYQPEAPPEGQWQFFGVYYYNQAVMVFFNFINTFPTIIGQGLELVPGYAKQMYKVAQQQYEKYRKQREKDKNKDNLYDDSCKRNCIDQTPLVEKIEPDPNPSCKPKEKIQPPIPPRKRFEDDFIYKSRLPNITKKQCPCSKCERREAEGWSDNKPKCRNRLPPEDEMEKQQQPKKKGCKICPKESVETEDKSKQEDQPKRESLKTCKKCLLNKEKEQ